MKTIRVILLFSAFFLLGIVAGSHAQDNASSGVSPLLNENRTSVQSTEPGSKSESEVFWERLDLSKLGTADEHADGQSKVRTYSLYPQSFSAVKPEARQETPARSYLLSYDMNKESALVGMANIGNADKMELKKLYQSNIDTELLVGYQWGNYGSILFGRAAQLDRDGDTNFGHVYDMGWRIKFMKTF